MIGNSLISFNIVGRNSFPFQSQHINNRWTKLNWGRENKYDKCISKCMNKSGFELRHIHAMYLYIVELFRHERTMDILTWMLVDYITINGGIVELYTCLTTVYNHTELHIIGLYSYNWKLTHTS